MPAAMRLLSGAPTCDAYCTDAIGGTQSSEDAGERLETSYPSRVHTTLFQRARAFARAGLVVLATMSFAATANALTATTTTLAVAPTSATNGSVLTLTATVKAGGTALTGGTVTFTDTYNSVAETLGTVQVQSSNGTAGTAVLKQEFGWVGSHSIVATFNPPSAYQSSHSTAQSVTIIGPYLTATTLASSGSAGNYSLTATVMAVGSNSLSPTGNVSFLDTGNSNYSLGGALLGTGTIAQTTVEGSTSPVTAGNAPQGVAAGDFNGDGLIDLAVLNGTSKTITILKGDGAGGFTASGTTYATGNNPVAIVAADFNGDGRLDLAVANSSDNTISIFAWEGPMAGSSRR